MSTLFDFCPRKSSEEENAIFLREQEGRVISYGDFERAVLERAEHFGEQGLREAQRVAFWPRPTIEDCISLFAIQSCHAVPMLFPQEISRIDCEKRIAVVNADWFLQAPIEDLGPTLRGDAPAKNREFNVTKALKSETVALGVFTSGSSGKLRYALFSWKNIKAHESISQSVTGLTKGDQWLCSISLAHIGGAMILYRCYFAGASVLLPREIRHVQIFCAIEVYSPSHLSFIPETMQKIISANENLLPYLRKAKSILISGARISEQLIEEMQNKNVNAWLCYGMTETCSHVCAGKTSDPDRKPGSIGRALPRVMLSVDGEAEEGGILIEGDMVAHSLFEEGRGEFELFGRFLSSDIGTLDAAGNLHIQGRRDRVVISGGKKFSLDRFESIAENVFGIGNVAALPVEDLEWGQSWELYVEGQAQEALEEKLAELLCAWEKPKAIFYRKKLPRLHNGKLFYAGIAAGELP